MKITLQYTRSWRTKPHPYWFARNYQTMWTVQLGPLELFYYKRLHFNN